MTDTDTQSATPGGAPTEVGHTHPAAQVELAWSDVGETIEDVQDTMRHSWVIAGVSAGSVFAASALVALGIASIGWVVHTSTTRPATVTPTTSTVTTEPPPVTVTEPPPVSAEPGQQLVPSATPGAPVLTAAEDRAFLARRFGPWGNATADTSGNPLAPPATEVARAHLACRLLLQAPTFGAAVGDMVTQTGMSRSAADCLLTDAMESYEQC
jgi:hypothetical protein